MSFGPRRSRAGFPVQPLRSTFTEARFAPTLGYSDSPDLQQAPGSLTSGRNVWIWQNRLQPRPRLQQLGTTNVLHDVPTGAWMYHDVSGLDYPMLASKSTVAYLNGSSWQPLTYSSAASTFPPSGGVNDHWNATSVYLPRIDANLAVMANGVDPLFAWAGPSNGTAYSTLSQAPIAVDVAQLQDYLVAWNCRELSSTSQLVTRAKWSARGNPEIWDDPTQFAGFQDLLDMQGIGTRVFAVNDQLLFASTEELWTARWTGPPYVFDFQPAHRQIGMPYGRAAIQTPVGLFWLDGDFMVNRVAGGGVEEVGKAVQRTLHNTLADPATAFFGLHGDARQLSLYYSDTIGTSPKRGLTLNLLTGTWTPQTFAQPLVVGFESPFPPSSATTWGALVGSFASQTQTYNQLLGLPGALFEATAASAGTAYVFSHSATSDDGQPVTSEAVLGTCFAALPDRKKFADVVRVDVRADSASSFSVGLSADLGQSYGAEQQFAISAQSATSQYIMHTGLDGVYHTVRVRSESPSWELSGVAVRARIGGEAI